VCVRVCACVYLCAICLFLCTQIFIMYLFIHENEYIFFVNGSLFHSSFLNQPFTLLLFVYTNLFSYVSIYLSLSTKLWGQFQLQRCLFIGLFPQNYGVNSYYKCIYLLASFHKTTRLIPLQRCLFIGLFPQNDGVNSYYNGGLFPRLYCKYILVYTDDFLSISFLTALDMASIMEV